MLAHVISCSPLLMIYIFPFLPLIVPFLGCVTLSQTKLDCALYFSIPRLFVPFLECVTLSLHVPACPLYFSIPPLCVPFLECVTLSQKVPAYALNFSIPPTLCPTSRVCHIVPERTCLCFIFFHSPHSLSHF